MNKAFVNGVHIGYESIGEGFPLIAITGKDANRDWWSPAIKAGLSDKRRLILLDNRGTGQSDAPEEAYSIADMAKDVVGLMDTLGIEQAHVLGQSMGGMIAQEIAIEYPERVAKLILCSTTCGVTRTLPTFRMLKWMSRKTTAFSPQDTLDMLYPEPYIRENPDIIAASVERMQRSPPARRTMDIHKQASRSFDSFKRLGKITSPTLIIHGMKDWVFRPAHAKMVNRRITDSRLLLYANAGHGVLTQEYRKVLAEIGRFIDEKDDN
ncbi:alpha/beta fold hydrolase [Cohnella yongneupensis]|uniref:Alpha/beta fold hydrolase n=1 Tax=Cohnella yongneupensis TaxID=425006 RepID=A0ABW0R050_9BACL